jgi:hypothetical protein
MSVLTRVSVFRILLDSDAVWHGLRYGGEIVIDGSKGTWEEASLCNVVKSKDCLAEHVARTKETVKDTDSSWEAAT